MLMMKVVTSSVARNDDESKALNTSTFDLKLQACAVCFFREEMRMRAKHSMLLRLILRFRNCAVLLFECEDVSKGLNASS